MYVSEGSALFLNTIKLATSHHHIHEDEIFLMLSWTVNLEFSWVTQYYIFPNCLHMHLFVSMSLTDSRVQELSPQRLPLWWGHQHPPDPASVPWSPGRLPHAEWLDSLQASQVITSPVPREQTLILPTIVCRMSSITMLSVVTILTIFFFFLHFVRFLFKHILCGLQLKVCLSFNPGICQPNQCSFALQITL